MSLPTTSGEYAYTMTARDIVATALQENSIVALGEEPTAEELQACILRLNGLLKSASTEGVGSWRDQSMTVTIEGGTGAVTLPAYVREVTAVRMIQSVTYQRSLGLWDRAEFQSLVNKTAAGNPTVAWFDRQRDAPVLRVWPVPASDIQVAIDFDKAFETITDASQFIDVPEELLETIYTNLAVRCAGLFGEQPKAELVVRAEKLWRQLLDQSRPASYYLGQYA